MAPAIVGLGGLERMVRGCHAHSKLTEWRAAIAQLTNGKRARPQRFNRGWMCLGGGFLGVPFGDLILEGGRTW